MPPKPSHKITLIKNGKDVGTIPSTSKPDTVVDADSIELRGNTYKLILFHASKMGAINRAAVIRSEGYVPNHIGLARVFRLKTGYWGVFVADGGWRRK